MRKSIAQIIVFTDVYVICKTTSDLELEALRYKPVRQYNVKDKVSKEAKIKNRYNQVPHLMGK